MPFWLIRWVVVGAIGLLSSIGAFFTEMGRAVSFSDGVQMSARVLESWSEQSTGRRGSTRNSYYMSASFQTLDGNVIKVDRQPVSYATFREYRRGALVPITYNKSDPTQVHLGPGSPGDGARTMLPYFVAGLVMVLAFLLWQFRGLIGFGASAAGQVAGRAAAAHEAQADAANEQRMDQAIARAVENQASRPPMPVAAAGRQSPGFGRPERRGSFSSEGRAGFGRRSA